MKVSFKGQRSNYSRVRYFMHLTFFLKNGAAGVVCFQIYKRNSLNKTSLSQFLGEIVSNIQRLWLNVILLPCVSARVDLGVGDNKHDRRGLTAD